MNRSKSFTRLIYNTVLGFADKILVCVFGLVLRRIFIKYLGAELSGLSGLFGNIIEFLNLATAGFITAIYPRIYQCNVRNDYEGIRKVMRLSKQFYYIVAFIILLMGVICSFFLNQMIYDNQYTIGFLRTVFMIQVLTQCVRMISSPNVALLSAMEQGYYNIIFDIVLNIFMYAFKIIVIVNFHNYVYYLLIELLSYGLYVLALDVKVKKLYPWVKERILGKIERIAGLFSDIKKTVVMQVANFIFCSTDSVVISSSVGLIMVNAYSNYMTIATSVLAIYTSLDTAIRNFFGNKLAADSSSASKKDFMFNVTFLFYIIGTFCTVMYTCLIGPFVRVWLGDAYVQSLFIDVLFGLYVFFQILFNVPSEYLQILGHFKKDMKANIISAIVNLVLSVILVRYIGISGVLIGTLVGLLIRFIMRVIGSFQDIGISGAGFFGHIVVYSLTFGVILAISIKLCQCVTVANVYINLAVRFCIASLISTIPNLIIYSKKREFRFLLSVVSQKLKRKK